MYLVFQWNTELKFTFVYFPVWVANFSLKSPNLGGLLLSRNLGNTFSVVFLVKFQVVKFLTRYIQYGMMIFLYSYFLNQCWLLIGKMTIISSSE